MNKFYVTTPIYYVNDAPHIGHAYTTILADVLSRYQKLFGAETFFLTGTDEHGQKVQKSADDRGVSPQEHCDEYVERFSAIWKELNIENDFFIRTTMDFHKKVVQETLQELFDKDEIYESDYEGWYSVSEEMFYSEDDLVDGKSPMGKEVTKIREKNYFFRMAQYQDRLIKYIEDNPDFIQPKGKRSEVLGFLKKPLNDLCISRPKARISWGIELPFNPDFVTYVWFDALLNYLSAIGYRQKNERSELFEKFWPSSTHLIGKDILTTHSVYWTTMLMALELPLPHKIFAHGWWLTEDNSKMSKSEGKVISPLEMKDVVGVDALRYFLMRAMNPANDGQFTQDLVVSRVNSELANNLGNLLNRTCGLIVKYFDGKIPDVNTVSEDTKLLSTQARQISGKVRTHVEAIEINKAVEAVLELLSETNKYIDENKPWSVLKEGDLEKGAETLYTSLEVLRIVGILLSPVMPEKMAELLKRIGWNKEIQITDAEKWGLLETGEAVVKADALFPRIDVC